MEEMQSDAERTLNNLHVLAALSHNDKLLTNDDIFGIYSPTSLRGLMRMWYGENRCQNVQRVRTTVRAAISFVEKSLENVNSLIDHRGTDSETSAVTLMELRIATMVRHHFRMLSALRNAVGGIQNLLQTYRDDPVLTSQIQSLLDEVEDFFQVIRSHSEALRERYGGTSGLGEIVHKTLQS